MEKPEACSIISTMDSEHTNSSAEAIMVQFVGRLEAAFAGQAQTQAWQVFRRRLEEHFGALLGSLLRLYGQRDDFSEQLDAILRMAAQMWLARPESLRELDSRRQAEPQWFQSEQMMGGVCYVDLFANDLQGVRKKIDYFKELELTYLHLMPLFRAPEGNSDGGYAVSSYRDVNPALGTMQELASLADELRANGISLVLDYIFNHTSDEHDWALMAQAGDREYMGYYYIFPDRTMPDAYERTLREIFPDQRPGSFTYRPDMDSWVWTTFNSFQWDLNYSNPLVFRRMGEEMLNLANMGVEVLRLDALAFAWKQMGTVCESLPEVHVLVQAFNTLARISAPALLFKSEAIVHPDQVLEYISERECQVSYNPLLMALLWETLATREVRLLKLSMQHRFRIDPHCAWVNYVRSHDDIGWTFDDGDAGRLWINGYDHRRFLNAFYTGRFEGSFATGVPFQENPRTGDARISGTTASLAGLEKALREGNEWEVELAIRRILLLYSVAISIGGIPLLYLGDEVGTLNDYVYRDDPAKAGDSRWVHRPATDWVKVQRRHDPDTIEGRIFGRFMRLIELRKSDATLADGEMEVVETGNEHVFGYLRNHGDGRIVVLCNFSEGEQWMGTTQIVHYLQSASAQDLVTGEDFALGENLRLEPYKFLWLVSAR